MMYLNELFDNIRLIRIKYNDFTEDPQIEIFQMKMKYHLLRMNIYLMILVVM